MDSVQALQIGIDPSRSETGKMLLIEGFAGWLMSTLGHWLNLTILGGNKIQQVR
jgi:hypothetical protein